MEYVSPSGTTLPRPGLTTPNPSARLDMKPIANAPAQATNRPVTPTRPRTRLEAAIDALMERASTLPDEAVTKAWAATKLAGFLPVLPAFAAAMFGTLPLDTAANRRRAQRLPGALSASDPTVLGNNIHLDPNECYVITSDLHRSLPGARDWPRMQRTDRLYGVLLDHYGEHGWGLVEAGDVEDLWMVGGSAVGAAIDGLRLLGAALWPIDQRFSHAAARNQVRQIVNNHAATYATIADQFASQGRYWRISGNHDDSLSRPEVALALRLIIPGFAVQDLISLGEPGETPEAVLTHGHLTDPWNGPRGAWRGRIVTWLANSIADLRGHELGITGSEAREALLGGRAGNRLRSIRGPFSMDRDQFTLNETEIHEAFADCFGEEAGPWLVLGHTHVPGDGPWDPGTSSRYRRYVNAGSGVGERFLTAVEWDGTSNDRRPVLMAYARRSDVEVPPAVTDSTDPAHRIAVRPGPMQTIGSIDGEPVVKMELRAPATPAHG